MSHQYPGVIATDYNDRPMEGLSSADYETLTTQLSEQLACLLPQWLNDPIESLHTASDALANEWQASLTARGWLAAAGKRLDVDTSSCVGA